MNLEGLQAILEKEEIVATQRAEDLLNRPEIVDRVYQGHVRTYIPLSRQASSNENGQSVMEFERRVMREVKQAGAIRGYITAEYGHGKTSTALYLWQRAREENILAVPPFQLNKLTDLIRATYGWAKYEIQRTRPKSSAIAEAETLYNSLINRGAETLVHRYNMTLPDAQRMAREKPEILELTPADYIRFFEEMTKLAEKVGYEGLLIIADELQQYIDPEVKAGIKDPISPFFDVVGAILTRRNQLKFGLIVVLPPKELELLRSSRGDLIHRVLQVSLDLRTVYNQEFPQRLWERLAKEFNFQEHQARIISANCLTALGQIGARSDLSDGPRTVVNTLRRATRRYIEMSYPTDLPYTPETLINDLLQGNIQYDSSKRIAQVTSRVLAHSLVKGQPERERAVKWAAAFPNEGVTMDLQEAHNLAAIFDELAQSGGLGDLIIAVGDVRNRGFTLRDLQEAPIKTDWLSMMLREFGRTYFETAATTNEHALKGFISLLKTKVFPANQWAVVKEIVGRMTQNSGLIFTGSFTSTSRKFPERTIHVRILWEDEGVKDAHIEGEALIEIRLRRYLDHKESERRYQATPMEIDYNSHCLRLTLNLMRRVIDPPPNLEEQISAYISPFKLTPLLLLTLSQTLDEERKRNAIPKADDQFIKYNFQTDLMEHAFRELFNETVGMPVEAAQERIIEIALQQLLNTIYPDYEPLVVVGNWTSSLQKYRNALAHLETNYERQGQVTVEGTKTQIANLFTLSNTGLDSFARSFPQLIDGVSKLPSKEEGTVRFTLHPLEKMVRHWLQESKQKETAQAANKSYELHRLPKHEIYDRARERGYLEKEIDAILELMEARGLVEQDRRGYVREALTQAPSVDELETEINEWFAELKTLRSAFPNDQLLTNSADAVEKAQKITVELRQKPNDTLLLNSRKRVQHERQQLSLLADEKHKALLKEATNLARQIPAPEPRLKANLEKSLQGNVEYVVQVDDLRSRLFRQYTKLESDIDRLQQQIQATQATLKKEALELKTLVNLAGEVHAYEPKLAQLKQSHDQFQTAYKQYADWVNLVTDGSTLREELQQLGDMVLEQDQTFAQLSRDIRGHLSAGKLDALPDAPTYSVRLSELAETVRQIRAEATNRFTTLQERYRQALVSRLNFPPAQLWMPHQYNPVAPQFSYDQLRNDVQQAVNKYRQQLQQGLENEQKTITGTLQSPLFATLSSSDQGELREQGVALNGQLQEIQTQLTEAMQQAGDTAVINDFSEDGSGRFSNLLQTLSQVFAALKQVNQQTKQLSAKLTSLELTPEETSVYQAMQDESKDFATLRQLTTRLSEDGLWKALQGLNAKRRINIQISPVRYD